MTRRIGNPLPFFTGDDGLPIDGGKLFIGVVNEDPELMPQQVYLDEACTIPADQPLLIVGGFVTHDGNPVFFYIAGETYSMRVRDRDLGELLYFPDAVVEETAWQPANANLTAIASLVTTAYGLGFLSLADPDAAKTYLSLVASLALTGGTVTGNIIRDGGGPHLFHDDDAYVSGRVFVTANGASDPTSQAGDIWLELSA